MLPGVYEAQKKDGTIYYRSNITYRNKHISLGSYSSEEEAHFTYAEATLLLSDPTISIDHVHSHIRFLSFDKAIVLVNFRDNHVYIKTPIYLQKTYFEYFFSPKLVLKFDIDDLFYYSSHRIQKRGGHLFVNDYGMQYNILARYGIKNYSVPGKDFLFANEDSTDFRYSNIIIINSYAGVSIQNNAGKSEYQAKIHINGYYTIGAYDEDYIAAIAYNKACDLAKKAGIVKDFPVNYIDTLSAREYVSIYTTIEISNKFTDYLSELCQ